MSTPNDPKQLKSDKAEQQIKKAFCLVIRKNRLGTGLIHEPKIRSTLFFMLAALDMASNFFILRMVAIRILINLR
jgi:hypothetical protein